MAPSLSPVAADALLELAWASIREGVAGRSHTPPAPRGWPVELAAPAAAFVTVTVAGDLNGCIGTLEAVEPLGVAVARLVWDAAFADPRLPRLAAADLPAAAVKISVLGPLQPLDATTIDDVCLALRPGVDGLVLVAGARRATFLPAVWSSLPDPVDFVRHLHTKAGLDVRSLSLAPAWFRYEVAEIG
jgi:AmmeMemoRadiSam system protein A